MRSIIPLFLALLYIGLISSCLEVGMQPKEDVFRKKYFDLKQYFDQESQKLQGKVAAKKEVVFDLRSEVRIVNNLDFKHELTVFSNADINRPSWSDKYLTDSIFNGNNELVSLKYKCLDKELKTQEFAIDFTNGKITNVEIAVFSNSSIANSIQKLWYKPNLGYGIESLQKILGSEETLLKSIVTFID